MNNMTKNIGIEADGDLVFTTVAKYKLFMSYGKIGMDAYLLYSHLQFTARLQGTNNVKASKMYIRQGLHWGQDRYYNARKLLEQLELMKTIEKRNEKGQITGHYIEVKTKTNPFEIENIEYPEYPKPEDPKPTSGKEVHKCFNEKDKCLNKEGKSVEKSTSPPTNKKFSKKIYIADSPPTFDEVQDWYNHKKYTFNLKAFYDKYDSNGWTNSAGKKMISWKGTMSTWQHSKYNEQKKQEYDYWEV